MIEEELDFENRIVSPEYSGRDDDTEVTLRPKTLDEYVGQDKVKDNLSIYIKAALKRRESLDHVLLYGPPGLGKTTLSSIIAPEKGGNLWVTSGPAIEKQGDLVAIITSLLVPQHAQVSLLHRFVTVLVCFYALNCIHLNSWRKLLPVQRGYSVFR